MNREKVVVVPAGETYRVSYSLDISDVIDAKVYDMSRSGCMPKMAPCDMQRHMPESGCSIIRSMTRSLLRRY